MINSGLKGAFILAATVAVAAISPNSYAQEAGVPANGLYLQGSKSSRSFGDAEFETIGYTTPFMKPTDVWGSSITGYWDLYVSRVETPTQGGARQKFEQIGITPTFRYRPDAGASRVFVDAGIGLSYFTRHYFIRHQEFSTRMNFASSVAIGYALGDMRQHEISLRLQHISNGGLEKPNPGDNLAQIRYAYRF